jgi:glycosyltransferase involved in cell wall biosynthesis
MSVLHDLVAFLAVYRGSTHIVVLGVSGGPWFPLFKALTWCGRKTLAVNIDGIEWQRGKFSRFRKAVLYAFDHMAQRCADVVVYDNAALAGYVSPASRARATMIPYSGDHVLRLEPATPREGGLTICRIEPENNIEMLIVGALASSLAHYTIIGNWTNSAYGQALRAKYGTEPRLRMVDPIYDQAVLARYREDCAVYLHGHSVGGTNPSLVEMLFYDCRILCLDVSYHRETAGDCAAYFPNAAILATQLDQLDDLPLGDRTARRQRYTRATIAHAYLDALGVARTAG